jgi:hypothetical protein
MAETIDIRPTMLGNMKMVSGDYDSGGGTISLADHLSNILMVTVTADGGTPNAGACASINGTDIVITANSVAGQWTAIGQR